MNRSPRAIRVALLAAVLAVLPAGCSTGAPSGGGTGSLPTSAATSPPATPTTPTTPTTPNTPSGSASPTGTAAPNGVVTFGWGWPNAPAHPATVRHSYPVPPLPVLRAIAIDTHRQQVPRYDRIAFTFTGTVPGYDVRWVDELRADGSGEPVQVHGDRILRVRFSQAQAHDDAGRNTVLSAPPEQIDYPVIAGYARAGDFEGVLSYGVGAHDTDHAAQVPIRITEYRSGDRYTVAIDIRG